MARATHVHWNTKKSVASSRQGWLLVSLCYDCEYMCSTRAPSDNTYSPYDFMEWWKIYGNNTVRYRDAVQHASEAGMLPQSIKTRGLSVAEIPTLRVFKAKVLNMSGAGRQAPSSFLVWHDSEH